MDFVTHRDFLAVLDSGMDELELFAISAGAIEVHLDDDIHSYKQMNTHEVGDSDASILVFHNGNALAEDVDVAIQELVRIYNTEYVAE